MSAESQLHTPEKVVEILERRGYECALFYDGFRFYVVKHKDKRTGRDTTAFKRHMDEAPGELVGIYSPEIMFGDLAADMAFVRRQETA